MKHSDLTETVIAAEWIPPKDARALVNLYTSSRMSWAYFFKGDVSLANKPRGEKKKIQTDYFKACQALQGLLTDKSLKAFWQKVDKNGKDGKVSAYIFDMQADWILRPDITKAEKNEKIEKIRKALIGIIYELQKETSLEKEMTAALERTIKRYIFQPPGQQLALQAHQSIRFLESLVQNIAFDGEDTHEFFAQPRGKSAKKQYLLKRMCHAVENILGKKSPSHVEKILSVMYPDLLLTAEDAKQAYISLEKAAVKKLG